MCVCVCVRYSIWYPEANEKVTRIYLNRWRIYLLIPQTQSFSFSCVCQMLTKVTVS